MLVGIAGVAAGAASTEKFASTFQNQSQLELVMRQLADFARDSSPTTGLQYTPCAQVTSPVTATSAGTGTYQSQLNTRFPSPLPAGVSHLGFIAVYESKTGTAFHDGVATIPKYPTTGCAANTGDWGVQEIKLAVFGGGSEVSRTVWKSDAWCYNPANSPPQC